ncbi:MAG: aminoacyl-histidine dipeptidase [Erysipelothrix sp.]|nr:aminoacyl-histidine dipeptidase [Erysipelothrix sp.]
MVIEYFKKISQIPRASFQEEKIADYLVSFANERELVVYRDEMHNVIIYKAASEGYEDHAPIMLQGHTDMVAEKNADSLHDFEKDPIEIIEKDGWFHANKTTLGADDGVAVAYMLAVLDDKSLKHPPLECVFTVQEEVGLNGAINLDFSKLRATRLIGLDSSGEYRTTISSSGGTRGEINYPIKYEKTLKTRMTIQVRGLLGGHSGADIDKEKANAIKLAADVLSLLLEDFDIGFSSIHGGLKENAIPRECDLILGMRGDQADEILEKLADIEKQIQGVYQISDPQISIKGIIEQKDTYVLNGFASKEFSSLLSLLPYGYFHKSMVIDDLVVHSMNIGTVRTKEDKITVAISIRSPQPYLLNSTKRQVDMICDLCNAESSYHSGYPGWDYDPNSTLRKTLEEAFKEQYGYDIKLEATHGGLELGIFKGNIPDCDIVAFGPIMHDIHTPNERLDIESFKRTYELLKNLLRKL